MHATGPIGRTTTLAATIRPRAKLAGHHVRRGGSSRLPSFVRRPATTRGDENAVANRAGKLREAIGCTYYSPVAEFNAFSGILMITSPWQFNACHACRAAL